MHCLGQQICDMFKLLFYMATTSAPNSINNTLHYILTFFPRNTSMQHSSHVHTRFINSIYRPHANNTSTHHHIHTLITP